VSALSHSVTLLTFFELGISHQRRLSDEVLDKTLPPTLEDSETRTSSMMDFLKIKRGLVSKLNHHRSPVSLKQIHLTTVKLSANLEGTKTEDGVWAVVFPLCRRVGGG
jgi:hypothetical protein